MIIDVDGPPVVTSAPPDADSRPPLPGDLRSREGFLLRLEAMAENAFADGRDVAAQRYMSLLGKAQGFLAMPDAEVEQEADDLEVLRDVVRRLVRAGKLDLGELMAGDGKPTA